MGRALHQLSCLPAASWHLLRWWVVFGCTNTFELHQHAQHPRIAAHKLSDRHIGRIGYAAKVPDSRKAAAAADCLEPGQDSHPVCELGELVGDPVGHIVAVGGAGVGTQDHSPIEAGCHDGGLRKGSSDSLVDWQYHVRSESFLWGRVPKRGEDRWLDAASMEESARVSVQDKQTSAAAGNTIKAWSRTHSHRYIPLLQLSLKVFGLLPQILHRGATSLSVSLCTNDSCYSLLIGQ